MRSYQAGDVLDLFRAVAIIVPIRSAVSWQGRPDKDKMLHQHCQRLNLHDSDTIVSMQRLPWNSDFCVHNSQCTRPAAVYGAREVVTSEC